LLAKNQINPIPKIHQISWYPQIDGILRTQASYPAPGSPKKLFPSTCPGPPPKKSQIKTITYY